MPVAFGAANDYFCFVFNLHAQIIENPDHFRQLRCGDTLITIYDCPLQNKFADVWSHCNYIVYVFEGRKIWHTAHGSYDLRPGSCVLVGKGANIVEQFFDVRFCLVVFFIPDAFICDVLNSRSIPLAASDKHFEPIIAIGNNAAVQGFFHSMIPHFNAQTGPDLSLLELKFRELILTLASDPHNEELLSYFCSLLQGPQAVDLQRVMEDNFCFNLKLEAFARLSSRSLSAFKREFQQRYQTSPGKWLLEKRLNHALHLLTNRGRTVAEAAFESGFESASHFSRAFRQRFGQSPVSLKQAPSG